MQARGEVPSAKTGSSSSSSKAPNSARLTRHRQHVAVRRRALEKRQTDRDDDDDPWPASQPASQGDCRHPNERRAGKNEEEAVSSLLLCNPHHCLHCLTLCPVSVKCLCALSVKCLCASNVLTALPLPD